MRYHGTSRFAGVWDDSKLYVDFNSPRAQRRHCGTDRSSAIQGSAAAGHSGFGKRESESRGGAREPGEAKAGLVQTKADHERTAGLFNERILSQQQLDLAKANYDSANATVGAAAANVTQAEAQVSQKEAAVTDRRRILITR